MKLKSTQIRDRIVSYLKTLPEITCCKIDIDSQDILLKSINDSNLEISPNKIYFACNTSDEYFINLIQANIKQSLAIEISTFLNTLFELNSDDCLYESLDDIDLELTKLDFHYESRDKIYQEIKEEITKHLLSINLIKSCTISFSSSLELKNINNSNFIISANILLLLNNDNDENYLSNLIQANLKQSEAMDICYFLLKIYTKHPDTFIYAQDNTVFEFISDENKGIQC